MIRRIPPCPQARRWGFGFAAPIEWSAAPSLSIARFASRGQVQVRENHAFPATFVSVPAKPQSSRKWMEGNLAHRNYIPFATRIFSPRWARAFRFAFGVLGCIYLLSGPANVSRPILQNRVGL